jgi:hypothetical protein
MWGGQMKPRRYLIILSGILIVFIMTFFLQDVVHRAVVVPLAYLWWVLKTYYSAVPQLLMWMILLVTLVMVFITNMFRWISIGQKSRQSTKPVQGSVKILARWISNPGDGNYYKWMVANRLGNLSRDMDVPLENQPGLENTENLVDADQRKVIAVQRYLKAGLEESFVDYPLPQIPFMHRKETPFDLDVKQVVKYLESQMEVRSGKKHS